MKPRFFVFALGVPALLSVYVGCGGSDVQDAEPGGSRKGSTSKSGKGGTGGKGGSGSDLPGGKSGAGGGELVIDEQEPDTCSHDACDPGLPLPEQCSPCVGTVCKARPACCNEHWDDECTHLARGVATCACDDGGIGTGASGATGTGGAQNSGKGGTGGTNGTGTGGAQSSGKGGTGGTNGTGTGGTSTGSAGTASTPTPSCSHTPCEEGGPLKTKCSLCAAQVCAQKASCCLDAWTDECLQVAATVQGCSCSPPSSGGGTGGSGTGTAGSGSSNGGSSNGGSSNGKGGSASGGTNGSGSNGSGGANGSGSNGSGSNGSGGANGSGSNGSGSNGSGSNGSGSSSAEGGNGSGSSTGEAGNGGQAGFLVGGAGGESGGCHSPCEEGDALSKFCGVVPFGICLYDPFCCNKENGSWNAACVGYATKLFMCPKKDDDRGGEPSCDHDVCASGSPLKADCDECSAKVCAKDAYCCESNWDGLCIAKASELCQKCNENAGKCEHAVCAVGGPLKTDCEACVADVCKEDDYCCTDSWDALCVKTAADYCECGKTCDHDACTRGGPLKKTCSDTIKAVCVDDPYCCSDDWDILCVNLAATKGGCGEKCGHDPCETGTALQPECGDCEKKICEKDPTCCDFSHGWDIVCRAEVEELCGKTCK